MKQTGLCEIRIVHLAQDQLSVYLRLCLPQLTMTHTHTYAHHTHTRLNSEEESVRTVQVSLVEASVSPSQAILALMKLM